MDLETISYRLGLYQTVLEFKRDVELVFSNAVLYNGEEHEVGRNAIELEAVFHQEMAKCFGGSSPHIPAVPSKSPQYKPHPSVGGEVDAVAATSTHNFSEDEAGYAPLDGRIDSDSKSDQDHCQQHNFGEKHTKVENPGFRNDDWLNELVPATGEQERLCMSHATIPRALAEPHLSQHENHVPKMPHASQVGPKKRQGANVQPAMNRDQRQKTVHKATIGMQLNEITEVRAANDSQKGKFEIEAGRQGSKTRIDVIFRLDRSGDRVRLGKGSFGSVYRGIMCHADVAIKTVPVYKNEKDRVLDEVDALQSLCHPHIVALYGHAVLKNKIHIVMELCERALSSEIGGFELLNPQCFFRIFLGIAKALEFIHCCKTIHRDLKPENILLTGRGHNTVAKLADFGLAKDHSEGDHHTAGAGTYLYMAPEQRGPYHTRRSTSYTPKIDLYSLSIIVSQVFENKRLTSLGDVNLTLQRLHTKTLAAFSLFESKEAVISFLETICMCASQDADNRPDASEVVDALLIVVRIFANEKRNEESFDEI